MLFVLPADFSGGNREQETWPWEEEKAEERSWMELQAGGSPYLKYPITLNILAALLCCSSTSSTYFLSQRLNHACYATAADWGVILRSLKVFPAWAVEERIHFQSSLNGSARPVQPKPQCQPQLLEEAGALGSH